MSDSSENLRTIGPAMIRTVSPYLVGWLVAAMASFGMNVDESTRVDLMTLTTMVVGTAYYAGVRFLEKNHPNAGWLLGYPHAPHYNDAD